MQVNTASIVGRTHAPWFRAPQPDPCRTRQRSTVQLEDLALTVRENSCNMGALDAVARRLSSGVRGARRVPAAARPRRGRRPGAAHPRGGT